MIFELYDLFKRNTVIHVIEPEMKMEMGWKNGMKLESLSNFGSFWAQTPRFQRLQWTLQVGGMGELHGIALCLIYCEVHCKHVCQDVSRAYNGEQFFFALQKRSENPVGRS